MISVVIPTYKNPEALDLCLRSAIEGQHNKNEIIVVVDGFYDLNKEVLEKYRSLVEILILPDNQGLCRATNLGVYNTSKDRILIVNDDNIFPKNWDLKLESLPMQTTEDENIVWAPNQIEPIPSMFKDFHIKDMGRDPKTFDLDKFWIFAEAMSFSKYKNCGSTLPIFMNKIDYMRIGGWDENYPQGMVADWDFFLKCQLSGLAMMRTYNTYFYHFGSLSVKDNMRIEAEITAHNYAAYKWGSPIKHNPENNLKYL